jgi:O-6-methylguanine DNA methyltransferase
LSGPTENALQIADKEVDYQHQELLEAVEGYFDSGEFCFDLGQLDFAGVTDFHQKVLRLCAEIEPGHTLTYGQLAARAGSPLAARAVGGAMAKNRWPLLIPCHRVVGSTGKLTGYSGTGGVGTKAWLLEHEQVAKSMENGFVGLLIWTAMRNLFPTEDLFRRKALIGAGGLRITMAPAFGATLLAEFWRFRGERERTGKSWRRHAAQGRFASAVSLSDQRVSELMDLALQGIEQEFPNKPSNVMASAEDVLSPKDMHPVFYGCFDWHSSVHGHWLLVRMLKLYPDSSRAKQARNLLNGQLTAEKLQLEAKYFDAKENKSFERMYGGLGYCG